VHGDLHADGQQCRMGRRLVQLLLQVALLGLLSERVHRDESALKAFDAGLKETLDLLVQIEECVVKQGRESTTDGRLADATNACQKYPHNRSPCVVAGLSERADSAAMYSTYAF
jgi:hypothetical protein